MRERLHPLKANTENKSNKNLEQARKVGGWLIIIPRSQDGTDLSREEFRYALWWCLDTPKVNKKLDAALLTN